MKDEEMAGEYAGNISGLDISTTIMVAKNKTDAYRLGIYEGFLAGLKAGRPQWHDLRKDPNDLPPRMGLGSEEVYVQYDTKGVTDFACYRFDKNIWERSEDDKQAVGVIAWCEIPTFDKE